jgi:hypothetical protein
MRSLLLAAVAALAFAGPASSWVAQMDASGHCHGAHGRFVPCPVRGIAPVCHRGKLCGHACIAKNKVCRQPTANWSQSSGGDRPMEKQAH